MNEEKKIKEKYFDDTTYLSCLNIDQKKLNNITDILNSIEQYGDENKGPDLVSKSNNKIYGIEHFEFDSSKNDRKGSRYKQQIGIIDNSMNKEIRYKKNVHNLSVLNLNQNIETYVNNYKVVFNNHYYKIPRYTKYLNKDFPNIDKEIWFFIEDITPFGNHYLDNNCNPQLFHPMLSIELIELLELSPALNGIFFATNSFGNAKIIFTYFNEKKERNLLKKICEKENVKNLLIQNPLCSSNLIKIDKLESKQHE